MALKSRGAEAGLHPGHLAAPEDQVEESKIGLISVPTPSANVRLPTRVNVPLPSVASSPQKGSQGRNYGPGCTLSPQVCQEGDMKHGNSLDIPVGASRPPVSPTQTLGSTPAAGCSQSRWKLQLCLLARARQAEGTREWARPPTALPATTVAAFPAVGLALCVPPAGLCWL